MMVEQILNKYKQTTLLSSLDLALQSKKPANIAIEGLVGSATSFIMTSLHQEVKHPMLFILEDKEQAAYFFNDLEYLQKKTNISFFPASHNRPYQIEAVNNANVLLRAETMQNIQNNNSQIIVSYAEAIFEKVSTRKELVKHTLNLVKGQSLTLDTLNEKLFSYNFKHTDFVTEPGEFSVRGGILDVFSFSHDEPYRIEFFGNEIDSIRTFDIETQLSINSVSEINIIPDLAHGVTQTQRQSLLDFLPETTIIVLSKKETINDTLNKLNEKALQIFQKEYTDSAHIQRSQPEDLYITSQYFNRQITKHHLIHINPDLQADYTHRLKYKTNPQPSFNKHFELLIENLNENNKKGISNYIFCSNEKQAHRLKDIFADSTKQVKQFHTINFPIHEGFVDHNTEIICYTDHQIFERYHRFRLKDGYSKKQALTLKELTSLQLGDYVTHMDHGIGRFAGLMKIEVDGKQQEAIKLIYGERDILYVSIHSLHKITRYNGKDGKEPKLYKLGSAAWKKLKQKTRVKVKELAFDLIQLYAKRKLQKGYAFGPDTYLQHTLESSFIYEDTPDQSTATEDVKRDMESEQPMDRLVCGDVGFGKTEVAIRAAFKAVDNGKQVAVLVPTTILAFQHYQTFIERLKGLPVNVDYLNRFRTAKERKEVIEGLASGKIDMVIGTHQLTNKSIKFKDLGLLIIDEEQKFGVAVKDKLKLIKENVDTLTLTATPIPRTLQFSLMAARDLSVIKTPPPNRYPVDTQSIRFSQETIRDAIHYELSRGGQVFFIHNRVENIKEVAGLIQRLVPYAKIGIGHGQMDGKKLEELMLQFMNNEFDILVSTTIVESGLDVPNANTIFINNANNFGLSDLHQMRGRVGRSNKKAFCYLITPPDSVMTPEAKKRIRVIEQFTDLGSGLNIAMKDLEIRGAGDILGGEQSGFINDIGFDTYQKILEETIRDLKENEFKELYKGTEHEIKDFVRETVIDTDFQLLFPDYYINNVTERLNLYTRLNELEKEKQLIDFEKELIDRFGNLPPEAKNLLQSMKIKWLANKIGLERIVMKKNSFIGYFIADAKHEFYQSDIFGSVLHFVQKNSQQAQLKEKQTRKGRRLLLKLHPAKSINEILTKLTFFEGLLNE